MDEKLCANLTEPQKAAVAAMIDALEVVKYDAANIPAWILMECVVALNKGLEAFDPNAPTR